MSISAQQDLLFGEMELEGELGEGGMGKVQLVRSRSTLQDDETGDSAVGDLREVLTSNGAIGQTELGSLGGFTRSRPHPDSDPKRAAQLTMEYLEAMRKWRSLPLWKRWMQSSQSAPQVFEDVPWIEFTPSSGI